MEILTYVENLHKMVEGRGNMFHHVCLFHKGWWKLIRLFGFALQGGWWEASKCTRCRGHVWGAAKFYFLWDSAQEELQHFPGTCNSAITTPLLHTFTPHTLPILIPMLPTFPQIHYYYFISTTTTFYAYCSLISHKLLSAIHMNKCCYLV
jgi:hypothetical protein